METSIQGAEMEHIISKVLDAAHGGIGVQSSGERLIAALALNRSDWLADFGYTIAEAIDRLDKEVVRSLPTIARRVADLLLKEQAANTEAAKTMALAKFSAAENDGVIDCAAKLYTYGSAPGYRDASLVFDLTPIGQKSSIRVDARIRIDDADSIVRHLLDVHRAAWSDGKPLDMRPGETRPRWIDSRG